MLTTFLDKLNGLLSPRFTLAYWAPAFILLVLCVGLVVAAFGFALVGAWWDAYTGTQQLMLGLGALLAVTVVAYLLQALTIPLVRLYEGYWPPWLQGMQQWCETAQRQARTKILQREEWRTLYYNFPGDEKYVRATSLGNTMTAAEEYAYFIYRADAIIWWPRLVPLLPETLRNQVDGAFTPLVALLNLSTLFGLWALGGGLVVALTDHRTWLFASVFFGGLLLAWSCYRAAITQAEDYGDLVRVAFDLYRHDLLKKLHVAVPDNLVEEQRLWRKLGNLHYYRTFPWIPTADQADVALPHDPLYYDTHKTDSPDPKPQALDVNVKGLSTVILRRTGGL